MTLAEVIDHLDDFGDDLTIYAASDPEWTPASQAAVASVRPTGLDYFLEVGLAKEAIRVWSEWRHGRLPSADDRFRAVWHYATYDAFLPDAS